MVSEVPVHDRLASLLLVLWQSRNITEAGHSGEKLFTSWQQGNKVVTGRAQGEGIPFQGMPPVTYFLHLALPPMFHHFSIMP
jgi:hypothetical protein